MDKIASKDLGRFVLATDVKVDVPVKTVYDGVTYSFTVVVQFGGASLEQVVEQAVRMTKTDFLNSIRPGANDKADTIAEKVKALEAYVQQRRVPVDVKDKGATRVITPQAIIANADTATLEALMKMIEERKAALANEKSGAGEKSE